MTSDWLARVIAGLLRWGAVVGLVLLCAALAGLGFASAYLLLTTGLEMLDQGLVWLLTVFAVVWGGVWVALLAMVIAAARRDE